MTPQEKYHVAIKKRVVSYKEVEGYAGDEVLLRICITPPIILRENIGFTTLSAKNTLY